MEKKPDVFSKDVPWYKPDIAEIDPAFRELLEGYSRIPPEAVKAHVLEIVGYLTTLAHYFPPPPNPFRSEQVS